MGRGEQWQGKGSQSNKFVHAGRKYTDEAVEEICRSCNYHGWEEVDFSLNQISSKGLRAILELCGRCDNLRVLKLYKNHIGDDCADDLADFVHWHKGLNEIHLSHNYLTDRGCWKILSAAASAEKGKRSRPMWIRMELNEVQNPDRILEELWPKGVCNRQDQFQCLSTWCKYGKPVHAPHLQKQREGRRGSKDGRDRDEDEANREERRPAIVLTARADSRGRYQSERELRSREGLVANSRPGSPLDNRRQHTTSHRRSCSSRADSSRSRSPRRTQRPCSRRAGSRTRSRSPRAERAWTRAPPPPPGVRRPPPAAAPRDVVRGSMQQELTRQGVGRQRPAGQEDRGERRGAATTTTSLQLRQRDTGRADRRSRSRSRGEAAAVRERVRTTTKPKMGPGRRVQPVDTAVHQQGDVQRVGPQPSGTCAPPPIAPSTYQRPPGSNQEVRGETRASHAGQQNASGGTDGDARPAEAPAVPAQDPPPEKFGPHPLYERSGDGGAADGTSFQADLAGGEPEGSPSPMRFADAADEQPAWGSPSPSSERRWEEDRGCAPPSPSPTPAEPVAHVREPSPVVAQAEGRFSELKHRLAQRWQAKPEDDLTMPPGQFL